MKILTTLIALFLTSSLLAGGSDFTKGPVIKNFGENAVIDSDIRIDPEHTFNVVFDVGKQGDQDKVNRAFNSLARFINMHARAGTKPENINLALVVHGKAAYDLLNNKSYEKEFLSDNPNHALLNELLKNRVRIYLCGQTAAYYDVKNSDLHPGVKMALSAMTAHALLQQQGYTLNPF